MKSSLELLDVEQTAAHVHCSVSHVYRLTSRREIPHIKVRGRVLFDRAKLDNWIASFAVPTKTARR